MTARRQIRVIFAAALSAVLTSIYPALASAGSLAYVISANHQTLTVIDTATNTIVTEVSVTDANRAARIRCR